MNIILKATNLTWKKGDKTILKEINFQLTPGECVGLVGPNGSGKSSLLKILAFLEAPTSGQLWFRGNSVSGSRIPLEIRRKIALVFQESLLLNTNVYDNVAIGLKIRGFHKKEIRPKVETWLDRFGILHLQKQQARTLSGGESQRVNLARAFILEPDVLFLDEPFSALDAPTKAALLTDLSKVFKTAKTTAVLVSHDFSDLENLTQRAALLIDGQIRAANSPSKLAEYWQTITQSQLI
ncbi:MAG: ATP-binding cassette domain-containing protein [Desulfitobacteriaceae bacterium]